ncbi:WbqC family protein [Herbaspirillum huttiense]|uniref:WbqC family protein n=1 Tax=Herbaspirillum huttiense subsp. lycopersici TaxID=3074428 RepID=A0ABU2EPP7_9BURK|nr:WbqC family protein [Herbaspirillum huttiense]MDR9849742.1 WbqC family protein [Herbaspirillum huttiense SE1]
MKKIAILQSNYIPWRGYFDMIAAVDEFILYDDMQYTRRDWRNRNQIKTPQGLQWLTVPVRVKGKYLQKIRETEIEGTAWAAEHWKSLQQNYRRATHFDQVAEWLHPLYQDCQHTHLSELNRGFIEAICGFLHIKTRITNSWDYELVDGKTERLVDLCLQAGATHYISGPSAKGYVEEEQFLRAGITLEWFDYAGFKDYPQQWGDFLPTVTILDLLFNCGSDAGQFLRNIPS